MIRPWRRIMMGLRTVLRPGSADRDIADEVQHYLDEGERDLVARGATPAEARRMVRLRYGDGLPAREDITMAGWEGMFRILGSDVRIAARRLRRSPGFTTVVVLTLGLGIGAATTIFSAVGPVLFEPLPYPDADRIVTVADRADDGTPMPMAFGTWAELSERSTAFVATSAFKPWQPTLTGGEEPERVEGQSVTAGYFDVLGVAPAMGPGFEVADDRPGGPSVVVLSDDLWRNRFGADPAVIGRAVHLDAEPHTVVGVMPAGFENPLAPMARVWTLLRYDRASSSFDTREWGRHLGMVARVRAGMGADATRGELDAIALEPVPEFTRPGWTSLEHGFTVRRLRDAVTVEARPVMLVLGGSVALLLIVTCVNLTILLLARASRRREEFATRRALGAGRGRLVRYLSTESLLLAGLGGVLGVLLARVGLDALVAVSPPSLLRGASPELDGVALGFALGLTTLVGLLIGSAPVLTRSGGLWGSLGEAGRGSLGSRWSPRTALVATEVALAVVLLIGAGLLVRSTQRLFAVPTGFDAPEVLVMQVPTSGLDEPGAHRFFDQALRAVEEVPGVRAAALTSQMPLSGDADVYGVRTDDAERTATEGGPAFRYAVTPGYFGVMGIPLLRGRALTEEDIGGAPRVTVVSESLARRRFGERDPLGRSIHVGGGDRPPFTIVGVVGDVKQASLAADAPDAVYTTPHQWHWADPVRWVAVHVDGDPAEVHPGIRRALWSVDGDQPIVRAQSLARLVERSEAQRRYVLLVLGVFAISALALAAIGLYGVLAGTVQDRMSEMGVRAALGASSEDLVTLVVGQGMAVAVIGAGVGLGVAALASRALETFLFGVSRLDPVTYLAVIVILASVCAVACMVPAVRAARVDPLRALRS